MNLINDLRWDRAVAIYRIRGNPARTDAEYENALTAAKAGELPPAPTERMAIGNYIDKAVKRDFRERLNSLGISTQGNRPIRIGSREHDSSREDSTFSVPDFRIEDTAIDITLKLKKPGDAQIRKFFASDFKLRSTIIIRPRQLGPNSSYIIETARRWR